MGIFGIILRNVDLDKKNKEKIHKCINKIEVKQSKKTGGKNEIEKK